jgi:hypothetical protein
MDAMPEITKTLADLPRFLWLLTLFCLLALPGTPALAAEPKVSIAVEQKDDIFIVDASIDVDVPLVMAWAVLTDFEHMPSIFENLKTSKITARDGNTVRVHQDGVAKYGFLSFFFTAEREIRLEPMQRIQTKNLSGTLKSMESEVLIIAREHSVKIIYHAAILPDSMLARMFGASFVRHEVEEQFLGMSREMMRRQALAALPEKSSPAKN